MGPTDFALAMSVFKVNLYRMGLAEDKNSVCEDTQTANHILSHCTVLAPSCSITNTSDKDMIEYINAHFHNRRYSPLLNHVYTIE